MKHDAYRRYLVSVLEAATQFELQQQEQSEHTPHRRWMSEDSLPGGHSHRVPSYEIQKAAFAQGPGFLKTPGTSRTTRRHTVHEYQTPQHTAYSLHTVYSASDTSSSESSDGETPKSRGSRFFRDDSVLPSFQGSSYSPRAGWHTTTVDPKLDRTIRRKLFSPLRMTPERRDALHHQLDGPQTELMQSPEDREQQRLRQVSKTVQCC